MQSDSRHQVGSETPKEIPRDGELRSVPNILTVDLEDWFHICEVEHVLPRERWDSLPSTVAAGTDLILEILNRWDARATFFVLGYVANRFPGLIRRIASLGHEIAYHGWDHELVYRLRPEELRKILQRGIDRLAELAGSRPLGYRAPQWSINQRSFWALDILASEGFVYDSSMAPLRFIGEESFPHEPCQMAIGGCSLWEFPPFTLPTPLGRYPAGGGWGLRCIPFDLLRKSILSSNLRGIPATFYFHPRELGGGGSVSGLPWIKRFVLDAGIWSARTQLARLLSTFRFTSVTGWLDRGIEQRST
jgi:polysaccharide deacetylase family protein (PEP-CTERM system associated)